MTPHEALEEILKDLSVSFGDGLAARIVMSARNNAQDFFGDWNGLNDWNCLNRSSSLIRSNRSSSSRRSSR